MKIKELKNWMREQFEQGNSILCTTAGQGGSGVAYMRPDMADWNIADVDKFDDNEISIVDNEDELNNVNSLLDYITYANENDAIIKLANAEGNIIYIVYNNDEGVEDITLTKGSYGHDLLEWSYMGKAYSCEGEFEISKYGYLMHTFIAPSGKEFEIMINYEQD